METGFETQLVNALQHVCAKKKKAIEEQISHL